MKELLTSFHALFRQQEFTEYLTKRYERGIKTLLDYMDQNNLILYDEKIGEDFLHSIHLKGNVSANKRSLLRRVVYLLNDILYDIPFRKKRIVLKTYPLTGELGVYAASFINHFRNEIRPTQHTLKKYEVALSHFTLYMEQERAGLKDISDVLISRFFGSLQNTRQNVSVPVRRFLHYLYAAQLIDSDLSVRLFSMKSPRSEKIPSFYTNEEIRKMDSVVERNSRVGKRNYAMYLLASRLGMRSGDIRNLTFSNIDWERNVLAFKQQKTGKEIELPLFTIIGEAIIDYIRNGRPQSNLKTIFLSANAPFTPITVSTFTSVITDIIYKAGIEPKGRRHGPHCLRHSLATNLLNQGTPLPVISEVLGHSHTESTKIYLNVDVESLLCCSLDVPPVPDRFYMQKGGWFYV